jgi:vacuolar-type H+-ATPase subunit E/Vma4
MNLDTFIQEIEERKTKKINLLDITLAEKIARIQHKKESTLKEMQQHYSDEAKAKSQKEAARIVEAARLKAKKILFDAINANMDSTINTIREELKTYSRKPDYKMTIEKMIKYAKMKLDSQDIVIHCSNDDTMILKEMNITTGSSIQTIGGILAENKTGTMELDLTFEELLRTHEDKIQNFLLEKLMKYPIHLPLAD